MSPRSSTDDPVRAWEGPVDAHALALEGPVGVRTDNVRAELTLRTVGEQLSTWPAGQ